ncbi:Phytanoyl-CoA dioxygenase (PhyH) [Xenococcus sp. PCC 7305]|uniref:phytanoyl-CoA dioxygenase family protein n=1 Tax=Xenococcus sp. PCC 7305 TaxID=102125 RepID=UPI0002ACA7B0|nr:phytanoyl-CoA dioxygenase family protein [Xenococcus sp. PCC 7305]ELS04580.1 Phytanoyl-CoA dioxygenase (PhyH) [Xenococcus sp. PCC 7305]
MVINNSLSSEKIINNNLSEEDLKKFREQGFIGPFKFMEADEVASLTKELKKITARAFFWKRLVAKIARIFKIQDHQIPSFVWGKAKWGKGLHATIPLMYKVSNDPVILDKISSILGDNVLQWSTQILSKTSDVDYPWHGDVEHIEWEGITVWLALSNVSDQTPMDIVTRTHALPNYTYPQELNRNEGIDLNDDQAVLEAAQKLDPECELLSMKLKPGEFFIFAGRLWHVPRIYSSLERTVMISQYSPPSEKIQIPTTFEPPITWKSSLPPCVLAKGKDDYGHNLVVEPPE